VIKISAVSRVETVCK